MGAKQSGEIPKKKDAGQASGPAGHTHGDLPKWLKVGAEVEAHWEGEWWPATVHSTSRRKWTAEVEWVQGGHGVNTVDVDDIRRRQEAKLGLADGEGWDSRKVSQQTEKQRREKEKLRARKKKEIEAAKDAARERVRKDQEEEAREREDREARAARAAAARSAASGPGAAQNAAMAVAGVLGVLALLPTALLLVLDFIVFAAASAVGITLLLPAIVVAVPALLLCRRACPGTDGAEPSPSPSPKGAAAKAAARGRDTPSPPPGGGGGGDGKQKLKPHQERKMKAQAMAALEEEMGKKQQRQLIRLLLFLVVIIALAVIVPMVVRKEAAGPNLYKVLNISENAPDAEIRRQYKALSKLWHPDKHRGAAQEEAKAKMELINQAKTTLLDPEKKEEYDKMREFTSRLGYEERSVAYGYRAHPAVTAYWECPDTVAEWWPQWSRHAGLLCLPIPWAHIIVHPIAAYVTYLYAHFGPVPRRWRKLATGLSYLGFLCAAASASLGLVLFGGQQHNYMSAVVLTLLPPMLAWYVDFALTRSEEREVKQFVEGARPVIRVERTEEMPRWVPTLCSLRGLLEAWGQVWQTYQPETVMVVMPDGEERLVGRFEFDEDQRRQRARRQGK